MKTSNLKTQKNDFVYYTKQIKTQSDAVEQLIAKSGLEHPVLMNAKNAIWQFENHQTSPVSKGKEVRSSQNIREQYARGFALLVKSAPQNISKAHFSILKEVFNTKEIAALCTYVSVSLASFHFAHLMEINAAADF